MTKALVATSSIKHPVRKMPNDAPHGSLRIVIWDEFSEHGASGQWYTGPHEGNTWWPRDVPMNAVMLIEARWKYDGYNLDEFSIGHNAWQTNHQDLEFRDILRQLDGFARRRGWKLDDSRSLPTEEQARDAERRKR